MANTVTDDAMVALEAAGFAVGSLADRELAYLTVETAVGGSFADKALDAGRTPRPVLGTYGPPPFDPTQVTSLLAWYSAEAETTYADGAEMTTWIDRSGNGYHAPVDSLANDPLWHATAGPGGGPAVEIQGVGANSIAAGFFKCPSAMWAGATAMEAMFYVKSGTAGNNGFNRFDSGGDNSHYSFSGTIYDKFGSTVRQSFVPSVAVTSWRRYNTWSATNDWGAKIDGNTEYTTAVNTVDVPAGFTRIGSGLEGLNQWAFGGFLSCVLLFSAKLSDADRLAVDAWMVENPSGGLP